MSDSTRIKAALADLAQYLCAQRSNILRAWQRSVEDDPQLTTSSSLSRAQFNDHIPQVLEAFERRLQAHMSGTPVGIAGHFLADLGHETRDRLGQVGCPCLVVHGDEDLITLPWYNRTVADLIPGATLASIPAAGHLAWLERPDEVNNLIERFLSRLPEPAYRAL